MSTPHDAGPYRHDDRNVSGPVQAIRVAVALCERFAVISRGTSYRETDQLELVLGEARQLYPEIWAQLDTARGQLNRLGVDTPAYDELRGTDPVGAGVVSVETSDKLISRLTDRSEKTGYFNSSGFARAQRGVELLKGVLPQIDWEALDRADADAIAAMGSLGPSRLKKLVFGALALVVLALAIAAIIAFKFRRQLMAREAESSKFQIDVKIPEIKFDGEAVGRQINEAAQKRWESRPREAPPTFDLPPPRELSLEPAR